MSDLTELEQFALASALHRAAPDHAGLADSISFGQQMAGVSPNAPDYDARLRGALRTMLGPLPAEVAAAQQQAAVQAAATAAARRADPRYQWTQEDVQAAGVDELNAAYERGQLTAEMGGVPPKRPQRRQPDAPLVFPSAAQNARWRSMEPWAARRARANWMAENLPEPVPQPPRPQYPHLQGSQRPTNQQLAERSIRRAQLTAEYSGPISAEYIAVAQPSVVVQWMNAGKLEVPPQRQHGRQQ
jgi:hypothetical protein